MSAKPLTASRGRPKTLDRDHIIDVAIRVYWEEWSGGVSLNELCKKAKVSKPGLYREFGNEDGLKKEVLVAYEKKVLDPILQLLSTDAPFRQTLDIIVSFASADNPIQEFPKGCLFVSMRESRMLVGDATREQIDCTHARILTVYEDWIERSKAKGEFTAGMSSEFAATYIYSQVSHALSQMARGEKGDDVKQILTMAFSMLV
jgi:AcrR family transcriptional regulator